MKLKLYRFEKDEPARIETINRGEIYLSAPQNFNDLDDCRMKGIFPTELAPAVYETLENCIALLYPPNAPSSWRHPLGNVVVEKLKEYFSRYKPEPNIDIVDIEGAVALIRSYIRHTTGVSCFFASEPEHPLMWAHYADSHKGFCVEYELDTGEEDNFPAGFHEVVYASQPPYPSILELLLTPEECINRIVTTKAIEWSYEKEVRYIEFNKFPATDNFRAPGSGQCIKLPPSLKVTRIITGQKYRENQLDFDTSVEPELYKNTFGRF